jgi:L-lactate dehydrogenase (cytochrome)
MMLLNVEDARRVAKRRLPRAIYGFVSGGADDERTLDANCRAFRDIALRPRALVDVSTRDTSVELFGDRIAMPVLLDPTGLTRVIRTEGELAVARAAGSTGTIYAVSIGASYSLEAIHRAALGPLWFQVYMWRDRDLVRSVVERARAAGYRALLVTIDVPVHGNRERDHRNGMTMPPSISARNFWDSAWRVRWLRDMLLRDKLTYANLSGIASGDTAVSIGSYIDRELSKPATDWSDITWLREIWEGPLLVKGIVRADDGRRAAQAGADGVIVSNHGGRQLDGLPATIEVLPEVVAAVGEQLTVLLDGGVRRGSDVVKALALGASACLVGRPYLWGLAAGGEAGVERVLRILATEVDRTLALLGCPAARDLDQSFVRRRSQLSGLPVERCDGAS